MQDVIQSVLKAFGQLGDPAIVRLLIKSIALTMIVFAALGLAMWWAIDAMIERWLIAALPADYSDTVAGIVALFVGIVAAWLLFRVVAVGVMQFFADEVIEAVETRYYPEVARTAQKLSFSRELANALRGMARTIGVNLLALPLVIVLLVTGIGPALLLLVVNGWLLGRELTDMTWLRRQSKAPGVNPVPKTTRFLLGTSIALLMLVPFIGFIASIVGAAAGTHIVHRALHQQ
ncbi:MAG: EI24 domain-containing protein [Pseudomonadota bacterium]